MIQIAVGRSRQLQRPEADVVERLVVDAVSLVGVFHQLVDGQRRVVRLHHGVRHLRRRHHGKRVHDPVGVLLAYFRDEQRSQAGAGAASQGVRQLEALHAVAALRLFADDVQDGVHEFRALGVVAFGPIVSRAALAEYEVVGSENLAERARAHRVHGAGLQVHQDRPGDVFSAGGFIIVHVYAF